MKDGWVNTLGKSLYFFSIFSKFFATMLVQSHMEFWTYIPLFDRISNLCPTLRTLSQFTTSFIKYSLTLSFQAFKTVDPTLRIWLIDDPLVTFSLSNFCRPSMMLGIWLKLRDWIIICVMMYHFFLRKVAKQLIILPKTSSQEKGGRILSSAMHARTRDKKRANGLLLGP